MIKSDQVKIIVINLFQMNFALKDDNSTRYTWNDAKNGVTIVLTCMYDYPVFNVVPNLASLMH